jgi:hypothetical protein
MVYRGDDTRTAPVWDKWLDKNHPCVLLCPRHAKRIPDAFRRRCAAEGRQRWLVVMPASDPSAARSARPPPGTWRVDLYTLWPLGEAAHAAVLAVMTACADRCGRSEGGRHYWAHVRGGHATILAECLDSLIMALPLDRRA